jgi:formylglycine-generating enzyme required for sulfatase activity
MLRPFLLRSGRLLTLCATLAAATARADDPLPRAGERHVIPDLALTLLWVKPGTFLMGSPPDEPARDQAEGPQTRVTLTRGFWLGRTEVTQAQYEAVTGTNPSRFKSAGPDAPVEHVSWLEAMAFGEQLTARERAAGRLPEGYRYTLPTEAQWEYACRAGTTTAYAGPVEAMAWYDENSERTTHPVARLQPNDWGFHDMSGNVLEWCRDWYGLYSGRPATDPAGPEDGRYRMARGGCWLMAKTVGRSAARAGGSPARVDHTLGFRLALVQESPGDAGAAVR